MEASYLELVRRKNVFASRLPCTSRWNAARCKRATGNDQQCIFVAAFSVFRLDDGTPLDKPCQLSFLTCATPVAYLTGRKIAELIIEQWVRRILEISSWYGYSVLGAGVVAPLAMIPPQQHQTWAVRTTL